MNKTVSTLLFLIGALVFAFIFALSLVSYSFYVRLLRLEQNINSNKSETGFLAKPGMTEGEEKIDISEIVAAEVSRAVATISGTVETRTVVEKTTEVVSTEVASQKGTSFVPLNGTKSTTNTNWETIEDSATYIDVINDYGEDAVITWSASLKVMHGNGQAFARIWDDTNKIAVSGSEITTVNNAGYETKVSGNLPLWKGKNLYKVQIKSLNGFEVTYSGGKMKITY